MLFKYGKDISKEESESHLKSFADYFFILFLLMKILTGKDILPNISIVLGEIDEHNLFYKDYNLKHPSALFNTSFRKVEEELKDFLLLYNQLTLEDLRNNKEEKLTQLIKLYKSFLYACREYLDGMTPKSQTACSSGILGKRNMNICPEVSLQPALKLEPKYYVN